MGVSASLAGPFTTPIIQTADLPQLPFTPYATLADFQAAAGANYVAPFFIAMCEAAIGNNARAAELFEEARLENSGWVLWLGTEPKLDSLRDFGPFLEVVRKTGLPG